MTRTIEDGFLEAIIAEPVDDTPRLIFADWLEENGQEERAEFIRVQCALSGLSEPDKSCPFLDDYGRSEPRWQEGVCQCRGCKLTRRERELQASPRFRVPFVHTPLGEYGLRCRRGFVEEITLHLPDWLAHGKELVRATPLRIARLTCKPANLASVILSYEQAVFGWLRQLAQDDEPGDNPVGRLHTLDLSGINIRNYHLTAAMDTAYRPWRGLRVLVLPPWRNLFGARRTQEIEQWKKRVPSLERVEFATSPTQEVDYAETIATRDRPVPVARFPSFGV